MLRNLRKRLGGVLIFSAVSLFGAQAAAGAPLPPASGISPAIASGSGIRVSLTVFLHRRRSLSVDLPAGGDANAYEGEHGLRDGSGRSDQ
jgi:hypothetical protein